MEPAKVTARTWTLWKTAAGALIAGGVLGGLCMVIADALEKPLLFALSPMVALVGIGLTLLVIVPATQPRN